MTHSQRQILVTGGNSGIGLEMVKAFVHAGHRVVIAARRLETTQAVIDELKREQPSAHIDAVSLDLGDNASIDQAAKDILACLPELDTVMMNAGNYRQHLKQLPNGIETMMGTMHFGHFRLMMQLLPTLHQRNMARIVVTSSVAHWAGTFASNHYRQPDRYWSSFAAYGSAKLANLLFTRELAKRVKGSSIRINAFHPGGVATGIWRGVPAPVQWIVNKIMLSPAQGADTGIWLALSEAGMHSSGDYFVRRKKAMSSQASQDPELMARLWHDSEQANGFSS